MALRFLQDDETEFETNNIRFNSLQKTFTLKGINNNFLEFQYALEKDNRFNTNHKEFSIYLFHKNVATNDIFQIKIDNQRLGWLFPVQALLSNEHDYAQDEHFFPYSFNAYRLLLSNARNLPYKLCSFNNDPTIEDIYGENTTILILYNKYIRQLKNVNKIQFNIEDYLLFFYSHGYTLLNENNFKSLINYDQPDPNVRAFSNTIVNLKPISKNLIVDKIYLNSLIQGLIKLEKHPLVRFHLLYSVIELFITRLFEAEFSNTLDAFKNMENFYDAKEKLTKLGNEKERIAKILSNKCPGLSPDLLNDLRDSCNNFLSFVFAPKIFSKPTGEALYKLRSTIFHNLRLVPSGYDNHLNAVLIKLESLILEISIKLSL
ncbi:hypothetical protein [Chitinophaga caseinilytica]|uniref:ApeA N-terminal domain-containing protein n=1 Tax=Chitinophaga caseinilytica TaxID=2267521 RepID=A0ABZ2Z0U2_9BACT